MIKKLKIVSFLTLALTGLFCSDIAQSETANTIVSVAMPAPPSLQNASVANEPVCVPTRVITEADKNRPLPKVILEKEIKLNTDVTGFQWSPDGTKFVTTEDWNTRLKIWDYGSSQVLHEFRIYGRWAMRFTPVFTKDGRYLITPPVPLSETDWNLKAAFSVVDVATGQVVRHVDGIIDPSKPDAHNVTDGIALSPDGKILFVQDHPSKRNYLIHVYETAAWKHTETFKSGSAMVLAAGPGNDQLTISAADGMVRVYSLGKKKFVSEFKGLDDYPKSMATDTSTCFVALGLASHSGTYDTVQNRVIMRVDNEPVRVLSLADGNKKYSVNAEYPVFSLSFSPTENLLAASTADGRLALYPLGHMTDWNVLHRFEPYSGQKVRFSFDGSRLAATGEQKVMFFRLQ
jgi:WD40 repeat protein